MFAVTYILFYGGLNAYCFWRFHAAFGGHAARPVALGVFLLLMVAGPFLLHRMDGSGHYGLVRAFAVLTWTWMGLVFWLACVHLAVDVWNGCATVWAHAAAGDASYRLSAASAAWVSVSVVAAASLWGVVEARRVRLVTVTVATDKLPAGQAPLRLVQVADLHLGRTTRSDVFLAALRRIREARADVLVSTGDLFDASDVQMTEFADMLRALPARGGKFAVTGNHEVYPGLPATLELHRRSGFTVLRSGVRAIRTRIRIAGVDDPALMQVLHIRGRCEEEVLPEADASCFTVLLKHRPTITEAARQRCDLQLSGHTHKGQTFPFGWIVRLFYPFPHGELITFPEGARLYVSNGTGAWGPPFRLLARPEVTLFLIVPSGGESESTG